MAHNKMEYRHFSVCSADGHREPTLTLAIIPLFGEDLCPYTNTDESPKAWAIGMSLRHRTDTPDKARARELSRDRALDAWEFAQAYYADPGRADWDQPVPGMAITNSRTLIKGTILELRDIEEWGKTKAYSLFHQFFFRTSCADQSTKF